MALAVVRIESSRGQKANHGRWVSSGDHEMGRLALADYGRLERLSSAEIPGDETVSKPLPPGRLTTV